MDRYEEFRRAATDRGIPAGEIDRFTGQLRFAIWTGKAGADDTEAGQLGGLPRLPAGLEWPRADSYPLPFIGSVDCAALPRVDGLPLPEDGTLLFFLHHEEDMEGQPHEGASEYARVLHVPAGTETTVADLPPGHDLSMFCEEIPFVIPEERISAWVHPDLPEWLEDRDAEFETADVKQLLAELEHVDQLCELVDELWPSPSRGSALRFGGYVSEVGSSDGPWTQMADDTLRNAPEPYLDLPREERFRRLHEEEDRLVREWVNLAQFYTQSDVYYGCFLISAEDLAAGRFGEMRSYTMFTE
ncbi:DUF1963 domain-containing protein [Lentzea sp. NPDC059081]|uniref:DUF1963 domain-containing protein n=1 Tax=Lentzea sp. NPDC059081 TaxID=3346719 RepID=UPI003681BF29